MWMLNSFIFDFFPAVLLLFVDDMASCHAYISYGGVDIVGRFNPVYRCRWLRLDKKLPLVGHWLLYLLSSRTSDIRDVLISASMRHAACNARAHVPIASMYILEYVRSYCLGTPPSIRTQLCKALLFRYSSNTFLWWRRMQTCSRLHHPWLLLKEAPGAPRFCPYIHIRICGPAWDFHVI